jgi:Zn-dependent peptidase ImmA (M78 family)
LITISFEDQSLHDACVDLQRAEQLFGSVNAASLVTFISEAAAFENAGELIDFLGGDAKVSSRDSLSVAIGSDYWATLVVVGRRFDRSADGGVVWSSVTRRLAFFNVGTMKAWKARYGRICSDTFFRTSQTFTSDAGAVLMWLRSGELAADMVSTNTWNAGNLRDRLTAIRKLSKVKRPALFLPKLKELCAEAGVAVVAKRAPKGCRASGASRMVAPDKAMILVSFRGLSDDKFWFTVFHEIGHLLLHNAKTFVDVDMEELNESEREANAFASFCIVPEGRVDEFERLGANRDAVVRFGVTVGVSAGLVVGQMQHRRMIPADQMNYLKRHWSWDDLAQVMD